jgi:hypothetical protein
MPTKASSTALTTSQKVHRIVHIALSVIATARPEEAL